MLPVMHEKRKGNNQNVSSEEDWGRVIVLTTSGKIFGLLTKRGVRWLEFGQVFFCIYGGERVGVHEPEKIERGRFTAILPNKLGEIFFWERMCSPKSPLASSGSHLDHLARFQS